MVITLCNPPSGRILCGRFVGKSLEKKIMTLTGIRTRALPSRYQLVAVLTKLVGSGQRLRQSVLMLMDTLDVATLSFLSVM